MTGREVDRMRLHRGARGLGLGDDGVVALRQVGSETGEHAEIFVDHREDLEAEPERRAARMKLAEGARGAGGRAGTGPEQVRRHGDALHMAGDHHAGCRVAPENVGRNARFCRGARVVRLDLAVDIGLGARAGQAQHDGTVREIDAPDDVGQAAEPFGMRVVSVIGVVGDAPQRLDRLGTFHDLTPPASCPFTIPVRPVSSSRAEETD